MKVFIVDIHDIWIGMEVSDKWNWKYPLIKQQKAQVIRILRPNEAHALIDHVSIDDEPSWSKGRQIPSLKEIGFTTDDLKLWLKFYLYAGCRFSEGIVIHQYRYPDGSTLYKDNGTLWLPRYKGKKMRSIQTRTIYFSNKGREIMDDFFDLPLFPSANSDEVTQTLISLTNIMHKAGEKINLPETTLTFTYERTLKDKDGNPIIEMIPSKKDFIQNSDGTFSQVMKQRIKKETEEKEIRTNGCAFRSLRKTWESWLSSYFGADPLMRERILTSQGHKKEVALSHYLEISFDKEDLGSIAGEVEGYAVLE